MDKFIVRGGKTLSGNINVKGSKNEAYQIICASLLTVNEVILNNVPNIIDIKIMLELLEILGVQITRFSTDSLKICSKKLDIEKLNSPTFIEYAQKIRGSAMLIAPLISRFSEITLPKPGGDKIGRRPIITHLRALEKMGASITYNNKASKYTIKAHNLQSSYILLEQASVTGTATVLMVASLIKGETIIYNAACEPYIFQLSVMLNNMGANIRGAGSNQIIVQGVETLSGVEHTIMPDIIEIGTFIGLAAVNKSNLKISLPHFDKSNIDNTELNFDSRISSFSKDLNSIKSYFTSYFFEPILRGFSKIGINIVLKGNTIFIEEQQNYHIGKTIDGTMPQLTDSPWPGFPPDLISIAIVTAINSVGTILIKQRMFESRLFFVDLLIEMGAHIILCDPHRVVVTGLNGTGKLRGTKIKSPDIRAGLALLIAALSAEGESIIENVYQIDRGYENIENRLKKLGAEIERVST